MSNQLTQSDIKKIKDEIEHRKLVVRKEALEAVKEAREHGDLSENFEYYAAKKDKNRNESRIRYLERMLKTAQVVERTGEEDAVGLEDTVEIYFVEDNEVETYRIVTSIREDVLHGRISIESPVGRALLGHKVGERVHVKVNDKMGYDVEIRTITKTNKEDEDNIRSF